MCWLLDCLQSSTDADEIYSGIAETLTADSYVQKKILGLNIFHSEEKEWARHTT